MKRIRIDYNQIGCYIPRQDPVLRHKFLVNMETKCTYASLDYIPIVHQPLLKYNGSLY